MSKRAKHFLFLLCWIIIASWVMIDIFWRKKTDRHIWNYWKSNVQNFLSGFALFLSRLGRKFAFPPFGCFFVSFVWFWFGYVSACPVFNPVIGNSRISQPLNSSFGFYVAFFNPCSLPIQKTPTPPKMLSNKLRKKTTDSTLVKSECFVEEVWFRMLTPISLSSPPPITNVPMRLSQCQQNHSRLSQPTCISNRQSINFHAT